MTEEQKKQEEKADDHISLSSENYKYIEKYDMINKEIESLEEEAEEVKEKIKKLMGKYRIARCHDYIVEWKTIVRRECDCDGFDKEVISRKFKVNKIKK